MSQGQKQVLVVYKGGSAQKEALQECVLGDLLELGSAGNVTAKGEVI